MSSNRHHSRKSKSWQPLKRLMQGLLRALFSFNSRRASQAGFVFPTTLLLILMVLLTVSALTYRTFTRSTQVIAQRDQQVIYNSATPAVDRAKAKLEFLFREDTRYPTATPNSDFLANMMLPVADRLPGGSPVGTDLVELSGLEDPYTLPDETRLDVNGGTRDNAWKFDADVDGDGTIEDGEVVVYSILMDHSAPDPSGAGSIELQDVANKDKAQALVTRTGPYATTEATGVCANANAVGLEEGWQKAQQSGTSDIQKNFQVNVFVANSKGVNQSFETLEFQQSRVSSSANKWGAWFRYDLDIFPGADFKWNGAMHTDGNLIVDTGNVKSYMLTSYNSCLYSEDASEITLGETDNFQGQAISGTIKENKFTGGGSEFHLFNGLAAAPTYGKKLGQGNDSVKEGSGTTPYDVAVNPIVLFLEDRLEHVTAPSSGSWSRAEDWDGSDLEDRIKNDPASEPYVDDFFRADNRWGPKPRYDSREEKRLSLEMDPADPADNNSVGEEITTADSDYAELVGSDEGLDGYWERQAIKSGLRLIVGERLELGNPKGWGHDPTLTKPNDPTTTLLVGDAQGDPLYPPKTKKSELTTNGGITIGNHQYRQHRTLQDNLAAVQSMAVYHYEANSGTFPLACMALTSHPGTEESIIDSRKFVTWDEYTQLQVTSPTIRTDFFTGNGTNGWEFQYNTAFDSDGKFATEIASNKPLGRAVRNLVRFAGDPKGGAPSFPPVQDAQIHPYPLMSMWGDFSTARRIIAPTESTDLPAKAYSALSPADKSTLHTAACTLSMLAYNVDALEKVKDSAFDTATLEKLGETIYELVDGVRDVTTETFDGETVVVNPEIAQLIGKKVFVEFETGNENDKSQAVFIGDRNDDGDANDSGEPDKVNNGKFGSNTFDPGDYYSTAGITQEELLLAALVEINGGQNGSNYGTSHPVSLADINYANTLMEAVQVRRDRIWGFKDGGAVPLAGEAASNDYTWDPSGSNVATISNGVGPGYDHKLYCDPDIFPVTDSDPTTRLQKKIGLAMALCSDKPKYPSLYYLFPYFDHEQDGDSSNDTGATLESATDLDFDVTTVVNHDQSAEEYGGDTYINTTNGSTDIYLAVAPADMAAVPGASTPTSWEIPATAAASGSLTNPDATTQAFSIQIGSNTDSPTVSNVAFLDKGIFNGREQLALRVLDIDVDSITKKRGAGDYWLPSDADDPSDPNDFATEGIFYAYREDAVREDEIVRPKNSSATGCDGRGASAFTIETDSNCKMRVEPGGSAPVIQDPPLQANDVSIKPVDFLPDPDRRAHGFRFKTASGNPADFSGALSSATVLTPKDGRQNGMTFVTDNAAYIQGDFNLHSTDGKRSGFIEEFDEILRTQPNFQENDFYDNRKTLDTANFANLEKDYWRPVEILADSLSVLSADFQDGAIENAFSKNNSKDSSYAGLVNRPKGVNPEDWLRQDVGNVQSPVWVDRNGTFYVKDGKKAADEYYDVVTNSGDFLPDNNQGQRNNNIPVASETHVNAVFVAGIVPERPNQSYGGLHNYPRFLEYWKDKDLFISGSFIQLNFSTSATAPFDHDAWEHADVSSTSEIFYYYDPPNRRWGFDVGLLYVPSAPAARRFTNPGQARSEYYREVPSDDPYIKNLKCATDPTNGGNKVFAQLCP